MPTLPPSNPDIFQFQSWLNHFTQQHQQRLPKPFLPALTQFAHLLIQWNQHVNLIARHHPAQLLHLLWHVHFPHSLSILPFIPESSVFLVDVGTGGGLPGIPLACALPKKHFLLIDARKKKVHFLHHAIAHLKLVNACLQWARIEHLPPLNCDVLLARAVGPLSQLLTWAKQHLRPGGQLLALKGPEDIPYARQLGIQIHSLETTLQPIAGNTAIGKYLYIWQKPQTTTSDHPTLPTP